MGALATALRTRVGKKSGIDQITSGQTGGDLRYIPLEDLQTWTGLGISPEFALNSITVYQCIRVLAETFAAVPLILYRRLPGGGKERAVDEDLYWTLHSQPNPEMTSFVWRELIMGHLGTWGNHYSEKVRDPNGRLQFWPIRPDRMDVGYDSTGRREYTYLRPNGTKQVMRPGSIFHVQGLSSDGLRGLSPIGLMRRTLSLYAQAEQYGSAVFSNGARPAFAVTHPQNVSQPAAERLATQLDRLRGSGNAGKTVILEEGMALAEVGFPPEDAQFMETRLFQKREIAGAYRVPLHKVNDLEHATFSNIEHQAIEFIQDSMLGWYVRMEQALLTQVIVDEAPGGELFAEHLVDGYLRGDAKARAEALDIRRRNGTLNADEWRAIENENPLPDGTGQTYYIPANWTPARAPGEEEPEEEEEGTEALVPMMAPPLTVVRSAVLPDVPAVTAVRCAHVRDSGQVCNHLFGEVGPSYRFTCPRCKNVTASPDLASAPDDDVPVVAPPAVKAADVVLDTGPFEDILNGFRSEVREAITELKAPRLRQVVRDGEGRIQAVMEG